MNNPWNLTGKQCQVMAALVEHGNAKAVASALETSHKSACNMLRRCFLRMNARCDVHAALLWDRFQRVEEQ